MNLPASRSLRATLAAVVAGSVAAVLIPLAVSPAGAASGADRAASSSAEAKTKKKRKQKLVSVQKANAASRLRGSWGIYKGPADLAWKGYEAASESEKDQLQWFIDQPKAAWFGSWVPEDEVDKRIKRYIELSQAGDPDALVQITIFRMKPWYTESRHRQPTKAEVASYKRWIKLSARAIGDTKTALFLQPDSTFLRTVPNFKLSSSLIRFAAKEYGKLPNTKVYLETGGHDWPAPGQGGVKEAVRLLKAQGITYADGIVTNTTHYNKTAWDVKRIADIVKAFEKKGVKGLKGVVNTSSNGKGFEFGKYTGKDPDHAFACGKKLKGTCATFGIPPTTDVANPKWGLDKKTRRLAKKYVDAYMWVGRPWLYRQASPFMLDRTIKMSKSTPYR